MHDRAGALLPLAMLAVMGLELLHLFAGMAWARGGAHIALLAVALLAIPRLGLREIYLLCLSASLGALLWVLYPEPGEGLRTALDQAVFLAAFVLLVSLIQEAAMTSKAVSDVGMYLARQPGGRRFFGLFGGTMVMAVVFNMATITLLAPLIRRAAEKAADDPLTPIRERRQLNALLRGFAWQVVWSPTAIAPLAFLALVDGIDRGAWIAMGIGIAMVMMVIGWAEDRYFWRRFTQKGRAWPDLPRRAVWQFLAVTAALAGLTGGIMVISGLAVPPALMAASPIVMLGWLIMQGADLGPRLRTVMQEGLPRSAGMAVTLGCAGFVGIAASALIPAADLAAWIGLDALRPWQFLLGCTLAVVILAQFALSPVMMAVFFGAMLGTLPSLPADPTLTAVAVASGWAVASTFSPFASGPIMLARISGHSGPKMTYRWNTVYSVLTLAALAVFYVSVA